MPWKQMMKMATFSKAAALKGKRAIVRRDTNQPSTARRMNQSE
jgi:hypothetical protein